MKNILSFVLKNIQLVIIVVLVLIVIFLLVFKFNVLSVVGIGGGKLKETSGNSAQITQAYVNVTVFGYDSRGGYKNNKAVMQYNPVLNIMTTKDIKDFEIKNIKLTNSIKAQKSFVTFPKHYGLLESSNTFYEPMGSKMSYESREDEGRDFSFKVVETPQFSDEVGKNGGIVSFRYTLYGLGKDFEYENILNTTGGYTGGKELKYAQLTQSDIESPIEFDVVITYTDKTKSIKHIILSTDFKEILERGFSFTYTYQDQYVGKEF